jgi:hypothetical protein
VGHDSDTKSSDEAPTEEEPRQPAVTLPEISPAQSPNTYFRLHREFRSGIGYVVTNEGLPNPNLGSVDIVFRDHQLTLSESLELLPIDLTFVPSQKNGLFVSVPPSERRINETFMSGLDEANMRARKFICIVVGPAEERRWNGESVFARRLLARPRITLPDIAASETWILKIEFLIDLQLDPVTIPSVPV